MKQGRNARNGNVSIEAHDYFILVCDILYPELYNNNIIIWSNQQNNKYSLCKPPTNWDSDINNYNYNIIKLMK